MKVIKYLCVAALAFSFIACKPTEKNYREAYDAAKAKREAAEAEKMIPASGLLSDDGPSMRIVEGDTLFVSNDRLRAVKTDSMHKAPAAYNVAVGVYRMSTNAEASAADLRKEGYDASAMQTTGNRWYTIVGSFADLKDARLLIGEFKKKNPGYPYIGLPGAPVIIGK